MYLSLPPLKFETFVFRLAHFAHPQRFRKNFVYVPTRRVRVAYIHIYSLRRRGGKM